MQIVSFIMILFIGCLMGMTIMAILSVDNYNSGKKVGYNEGWHDGYNEALDDEIKET